VTDADRAARGDQRQVGGCRARERIGVATRGAVREGPAGDAELAGVGDERGVGALDGGELAALVGEEDRDPGPEGLADVAGGAGGDAHLVTQLRELAAERIQGRSTALADA
jgi:hypothetical protein